MCMFEGWGEECTFFMYQRFLHIYADAEEQSI